MVGVSLKLRDMGLETERIRNILRQGITFSPQVGDYVIHGAIEAIQKEIETAFDDGYKKRYDDATAEAINEINRNYKPRH